jgi:hypothetical protein
MPIDRKRLAELRAAAPGRTLNDELIQAYERAARAAEAIRLDEGPWFPSELARTFLEARHAFHLACNRAMAVLAKADRRPRQSDANRRRNEARARFIVGYAAKFNELTRALVEWMRRENEVFRETIEGWNQNDDDCG